MQEEKRYPFLEGRYPANLVRAIFGIAYGDCSKEIIEQREKQLSEDPEVCALIESKLMTLKPIEMQAIKLTFEKGMDERACAMCLRIDPDEFRHVWARALRCMRHPSRAKELRPLENRLRDEE